MRARHRFRDNHCSRKVKFMLIRALVIQRLLHGAESWPPLSPDDWKLLYIPLVLALRLCSPAWSQLADPQLPDSA
eukprot:6193041-Prorocentrum_lima.AAC.1